MRDMLIYIVLLGLVAIGLVTGLGISGGASDQSSATTYAAQIVSLHAKIKAAYMPSGGNYGTSAIAVSSLIALGAVPEDMVVSTTQLRNPFGGSVTVTGGSTQVYYDADGISQAGCTQLLTQFPKGAGATSLAVASTLAGLSGATANAMPISLTNAATACSGTSNALRITMQ